MRCDYCRISVSLADPETAPPPPLPPSAAEAESPEERYISVTVGSALMYHATYTEDPPLLPVSRRFRTAVVPSRQFFAEARSSGSVIRRIVSDMNVNLTAEAFDGIARQSLSMCRAAIAENHSARVEAMKYLRSPTDLEQLMVEQAARRSAREARKTVPATKASIESLEYATVDEARDQGRCTICLEEIDNHDDDDDQDCDQRAVRMPCWHVYHQDCIVQWLEKNHKCPLCRHAMPTN